VGYKLQKLTTAQGNAGTSLKNVCNALQEVYISNQNDLDPLAVQ